MPPYVAGPHPWSDKFVPQHLSDGFGQLPFGHGDPLAFVCKEIPHDSRFSLGIESRDPDVPSCRHSWQYAPPRPPVNGPCRFRILNLLQPPSTEPPRLPSRAGKIRSPIQKISSHRFRSPAKPAVVTGPPGGRHALKCVGERSRHMLGNRSQNTGVVMAKTAKSRAWTKDNIRELKTLARQKVPVAKIAKSLKRTLRATQQKAYLIEACH